MDTATSTRIERLVHKTTRGVIRRLKRIEKELGQYDDDSATWDQEDREQFVQYYHQASDSITKARKASDSIAKAKTGEVQISDYNQLLRYYFDAENCLENVWKIFCSKSKYMKWIDT